MFFRFVFMSFAIIIIACFVAHTMNFSDSNILISFLIIMPRLEVNNYCEHNVLYLVMVFFFFDVF